MEAPATSPEASDTPRHHGPREALNHVLARTQRWFSELDAIRPRPAGDEVVAAMADRSDARFLLTPALLGLLALISIAVGSSLPSSPFKLEMPGTWFFGLPADPGGPPHIVADSRYLLFGLVAVYGGLVLLMRVWIPR